MTGRDRRSRHDEEVVLAGFLGTGNIGNDVSLEVVVEWIGHLRPDLRMRVLSYSPPRGRPLDLPVSALRLERTSPLRRVSRPADRLLVKIGDLLTLTRQLRSSQHVIIPGAGMLEQRLGGSAWGLPWALAATAIVTRLTGGRLHLVAIGADHPDSRLIRLFFRVVAGLATTRSFRDEASRDAVRALGVDSEEDHLVPDLAFARRLGHSPTEQPQGRVGLGVLAWYGPGDDHAAGARTHERYVQAVGRIAAGLLDEGLEVTLLVGDAIDQTVFAPVLAQVARHGHDPAGVTTRVSTDFDDLLEAVDGMDLVIASRFHNLVAAVIAARPLISLGYGPKHRALLEDLGMGERAHDIDDIDVEGLLSQARRAREQRAVESRHLRVAAERRANIVTAHLEELIDSWPQGATASTPTGITGATS